MLKSSNSTPTPRRAAEWAADARTIACLEGLRRRRARRAGRHGRSPHGRSRLSVCLRGNETRATGDADGIVTAPLSKAALHAAAHFYPGHTELLADLCGVNDFAMMLYLPPGAAVRGPAGLGVAHVTLHQSLRSVFRDLNTAAIVAKCRLADR